MPQFVGPEILKNKLISKRTRVLRRYQFYDMHVALERSDIPEHLRAITSVLGWCSKAVDTIADRLVFRGFDNDYFSMAEIFNANNPDVLADSAILAALIGSCSFVYIAPDADDFPRLRVIDGANATGVIDPVTYMLQEGYAVLERDELDQPVLEAYFMPGATAFYPAGGKPYVLTNAAPYPLLVPVIYRPDATRPFGHSRISRACMDLTLEAMRTLRRAGVAGEFYSYPQRYVLGMNSDAEEFDKWQAVVSSFLRIDKDEDGDKPVVGQFQQQSMTPYSDQIRMIAGLFAAETGMTLDDLGLPTQNPSSADAIKASHEQLRLTARKAQRTFGTGLRNVGYLSACIRDDYPYLRKQVYMTDILWEPIFEPDASQLSGIGDAVVKIQQSFPDYFDERKLRDLTGI